METAPAVSTAISAADVAQAQPKVVEKKAKAKAEKPKAKKAKAANPAKVKAFVEKFRAGTIGRLTVEMIVAGDKSNDEILKAVKSKHKSSTTAACIAWYRSKARKEGIIA